MFQFIFKALGEPTRLKIVKLLAERELCVCDLEEIMKISQPRISQHLKVLKYAGLVNERKDGQRTICSLNRSLLSNTLEQFEQYLDQPLETIPEMTEEFSRMPADIGEACMKKTCSKVC
ncbi:MAG TPA: metalloregulator ArsR/SmtB family transcription factor [Syntrophomonadaceae bacterium]|nr:metalloregulator ArsR/SmtB family transcription factor [Syntrophomonadaceae bacterium]HPR93717.1 metalloregulator ArsR/SmtB family transcription factor [Syntrophomonadaceae bacterium]